MRAVKCGEGVRCLSDVVVKHLACIVIVAAASASINIESKWIRKIGTNETKSNIDAAGKANTVKWDSKDDARLLFCNQCYNDLHAHF